MATSLLGFLCFSFINFWAPEMRWIIIGTFLQGVCCGGFGTLASTYISDVCPQNISNVLTGFISCCWIIGQLCSYSVLWIVSDVQGPGAYRIPMSVQWIIPVPVAIGCWLAPASPWALVREGRVQDAYKALQRLSSSPYYGAATANGEVMGDTAAARLVDIQQAIGGEAEKKTEDVSFLQCFRGTNLRRTELSILSNVSQIVVGFAIASQTLNFIRAAGLQSTDSIKMAFFNALVLLIGSFCYFAIHSRVSTRKIYIAGLILMWPVLALIGTLEAFKRFNVVNAQKGSWAQAILLFGWAFIYGATIGPSTNTLVCDLSLPALRTKTLSLARFANDGLNLLQAAAGPYMLSQDKLNLQGFTAFPAAGLVAMWILWSILRMPETKGLDQVTMDALFEARTPTRKFQSEAKRIRMLNECPSSSMWERSTDLSGTTV